MKQRWDIITLTKQREHITHKSSNLSQSSSLGKKIRLYMAIVRPTITYGYSITLESTNRMITKDICKENFKNNF